MLGLTAVLVTAPQQVTHWPQRLALTGIVLAMVALALWGMRRGWLARVARQTDVADLPSVPTDAAPVLLGPLPGRYFSTTSAQDWLDRIAVHGLGVRSSVELTVRSDGVLLRRGGAPDVFIPAQALTEARLDRAIAGAAYEAGGLVVLRWRLGDRLLDTGIRLTEPDLHPEVVRAATALIPAHAPGGTP